VQIFKFVSCSQERFPEIETRVPVSVKEFFPVLNPQRMAGIFVLLTGCIDESGDAQNFTLSCLISDGEGWFHAENALLDILEAKNKELLAQGRKPISRYHAADCASCKDDFEGWGVPEQIEFVKSLLDIFTKHHMDIISLSVNLDDLVQEVPVTKGNPKGFSYVVLLRLVMGEIGDVVLKRNPNHLISLVHDRCEYDCALLGAFEQTLRDPAFRYSHRFNNITAASWEHCVPLQLADLIAYEVHKDHQREIGKSGRPRRKSLRVLLEHGRLGGGGRAFDQASLQLLKQFIDEMSDGARGMLLDNARIRMR
jgi:hypothetical protein